MEKFKERIYNIHNYPGNWMIEKRYSSTGALVTSFGNGGRILVSNGPNGINGLKTDGVYLYIAGSHWHQDTRTYPTTYAEAITYTKDDYPEQRGIDWRIEKRLLTTGDLVPSFGNGGVFLGDAISGSINDIALDNEYIYIAGNNSGTTNNEMYRIAKISKTNGTFDMSFGINGNISSDGTKTASSIHAINDMLYIGGSLWTLSRNPWFIEKRSAKTGLLDTSFGADGTMKETRGLSGIKKIISHNNAIYVIGTGSESAGLIQKIFLNTGLLDSSFGDKGNVYANIKVAFPTNDMVVDITGAHLYTVGGHGALNGIIEKRVLK